MLMKRLLWVMSLIAGTMLICPFAACDGGTSNNGGGSITTPPEGWAKEFTIYVNGADEWTPFPGKSGVTFSNSDNGVLNVTNNGIKVEFVGKVVGESVITATHDGNEIKALVRVRAMAVAEGKKYITYNKPINAYYIEFNGGYIQANIKPGISRLVIAYENKEYMGIGGYNRDTGVESSYRSPNGIGYQRFSSNGDGYWISYSESKDPQNTAEWVNEGHKAFIYPLGEFAAFASGMQTSSLLDVAESSLYNLPNNVEVTQYYVRSEKVMDITCDVFKYQVATWWVDPSTGFTLKWAVDGGNSSNNWEVTKLVIGSPDWNGLHLRPQKGDTEDYEGETRIFN